MGNLDGARSSVRQKVGNLNHRNGLLPGQSPIFDQTMQLIKIRAKWRIQCRKHRFPELCCRGIVHPAMDIVTAELSELDETAHFIER